MTPAQGEKIHQLRMKLGLTPQQFGRTVGATAVVVAKWESGISEPGWQELGRMKRAYDVDLNWLLDSGNSRRDYLQDTVVRDGRLLETPGKSGRDAEQKLICDYRKLNEIDRSFIRMVLDMVGKTPKSTAIESLASRSRRSQSGAAI